MSRHDRRTTLKRRVAAVAEDWLGRALPDAERWTRASLVRCRGPYCLRCGHSSPQRYSVREGCPVCIDRRGVLDGVCRVGRYRGGCAQLVLALKFRRWWELARPLGSRLAWSVRAERGADCLRGAVVVPVPMPLIRRWRRGIDHAALIGREVASAGGAAYYAAMWRSRGAGQAGAARSTRLRASSHGWHLHLKAPSRLRGREVVLVDDVLTTGRTARIASRLLKQAGATSVTLAVVAVTDQSPDIGYKIEG
ncbi:MAG: phosphoribosyltransferase family protein [Phycisphaerales bacterium]|nr:phosphoribosyltransferase family protein [Phycisphaerales bacterium]MDP6310612.1 phosphoribosyltransferase family protein [Phycisphaerales bacterium]MDP7189979.1 phosphoribosyltransferase family protein [Phycisphaerales bacterium]MDP7519856.1 phosphoribosyltransferase family protein [Phycisphaerales bacterium]MDP7574890.1 phosphoribosyltransferase family protein [Phycisphaerales bacterium]